MADREFGLVSVAHSGSALQFASEAFKVPKRDQGFVMAAVAHDASTPVRGRGPQDILGFVLAAVAYV